MNRTYRLIWNETTQAFVPAPEFARGRRKRNGVSLLTGVALATFALNAYALPTDGQVTAGSGSIATSGTAMTVNQGSQNLSLNWASFNIAANEAVRFNQPNSSAIALNRVLGTDGSQILGSLSANGQVFILNPNGVLFGPNARVDVGGLVASTLKLSDADFLAGKYRFTGTGGAVLNQGTINASGYVALLGGQVSNDGVIVARLGKVALAAGNAVTLDLAGDKLLSLQVDEGAVEALAQNKGLIQADGGEVLLTARSADALIQTVVNNEGVIEAKTVENQNGVIKLLGDMTSGTVKVGGTLDASAPNGGDGGFIETSAAKVEFNSPTVTAAAPYGKGGQWLIDPTDITIDAARASTISSALSNGTSVWVDTSGTGSIWDDFGGSTDLGGSGADAGDITVASNIAKSGLNSATLTLKANRSITFNNNVSITAAESALNVVLDADSDTSGGGRILLYNANTITTNGGSILMGSGCNTLTGCSGPAQGLDGTVLDDTSGIYLNSATLNAGSGSITMTGKGATTSQSYSHGILIAGTSSLSAGGGITLTGTGGTGGTSKGVEIYNSSLSSSGGGITLNGTAGAGTTTGTGVELTLATLSAGGNVSVNGAGTSGYGIRIPYEVTRDTIIGGGTVTLTASTATGSDSLMLESFHGTGNLVLQPLTDATTIGLAGGTGAFNISATELSTSGSGFSNITIGRSGGTGAVDIGASGWTVPTSANLTILSAGSGGITQNGALTAGSGKNIVLAGGGNYVNNAGASALSVSGGGRWLVYSANPSTITKGGLTSGFRHYNATYGSYAPASVTESGNGFIYASAAGNLAVNVTGSASGTYGDAHSFGYSLSGTFADSEDSASNIGVSGTATYSGAPTATSNAGSYTVAYGSGLSSTSGYGFTAGTGLSYTVSPAALTITADNKSRVYGDANPAFTATYSGFKNSDASSVVSGLALNTAATAASNVGGYTITPSGASASNYTISYANGTLTVTPAALSITADNKSRVYGDANPAFTATYTGFKNSDTSAVVSGLTLGTAATIASNVGSYAITASGGTATNYTITHNNGMLTVAARPVSLTGSRVYDGAAAVNAGIFALGNLVSGEDLSLTGSGTVADKNAASGKTVTLGSLALGNGTTGLASNYTLTGGTHAATVTARTLNVGYTGINKTYDGTTAATVTTSDDRVTGDTLTLSRTATFADKNVGAGKTVSVSGVSLSGADAGNYTVTATGSTTANIAQRTLGVTYTGVNKTYDGTTAATITTNDDRVSGDTLTLSRTAAFSDKNAGAGKTVSVSGVSLSGTDAGNYALASTTGSTTADITARTLNASYTGVNKVYDGNVTASVTTSDDRVSGDALTINRSASFADKNVGSGKSVSVSGVSLSGTDAGNYTVAGTGSATADITPRTLTVTYGGVNKVYDGSTASTVTTNDDRVSGDTLTINRTAAFADKNVGTGKSVSISGVTLSGTDAGNYALASTGGSTAADITARTLNVSYTGINKTYDGTTSATVTTSDDRVSGDALTLSRTAAFSDKNAGTGKTVSVSGVSLSGADAGNYTLASATGSTTADITARTLNVGYTGINKTYDNTSDATVTTGDDRVSGDTLTINRTAAFSGRNVGAGKLVFVFGVSLSGTDAGNYTLASATGSTTADITARTLNVGYTGINKTYDGTSAATVTTSDDRIAGDDLYIARTAAFSDKNAGAGKAVSVSGVSLSGFSASNYTLASVTGSATADITPKTLTVAGSSAANKVYDGTTSATVTVGTLSGLVGAETVAATAAGAFADKNVGAGKTVTAAYTLADGTNGGLASNYTLANDSLTANITAAPLTVTANNYTKTYDRQAYSGGNGVSYSGFASGESASVLGGALAWGGTSQGAVNRGSYAITPSGLTSGNYMIGFADGTLTINLPAEPAAPGAPANGYSGALAGMTDTAAERKHSTPDDAVTTPPLSGLQIVGGGMRLPDGMGLLAEEERQRPANAYR